MTVTFGTTPTSEPPDEGSWVWAGDRWLAVISDTEDGVPEDLDLDEDGDD